MVSKVILCIYLFSNVFILINGAEKDEFFKVPLEIREQNRPTRLIDNVNDPDMQKLKSLQDTFFNIIGNSSVGREFKNFNQLLRLVDSEAGIEIGRLFVNGFMLGFGKQSSGQLFTEFIDDFHYRLTPELADALVDYKDFMKTVDIKMIPQTIGMLFRKDNLGNSLAQMPLGQLVDIIQPELSKYGIDARSVINGIIGKGDSTFPDLVSKLMSNLNTKQWVENISGLMNLVTKSTNNGNMEKNTLAENDNTIENIRPKKDKTLLMFKPLVANFLKSNKIDLDADAVIQVLTPFIGGAGEYLQNIIPALQGGGKDINFAQLLPLLGLFSSQFSGNKNKKNQEPNLLGAAMSLMGGLENNKDMVNILNLATQFLGKNKPEKNNLKKKTGSPNQGEMDSVENPSNVKNDGFDAATLLNMAASLAKDSDKGNGLGVLSGLVNEFTKDSEFDAQQMLNLASNLLGNIAKPKKEGANKPKTPERLVKKKKSKTFPGALEFFLLRIQSDKKCHLKIKDAFTLGKNLVSKNMIGVDQIKEQLTQVLKTFKPDKDYDIESLLRPFSFSQKEWSHFLSEMNSDVFRAIIITNTIGPAADLVAFIASDEFQTRQSIILKQKFNEGVSSFGLKGVTINNFPDRLSPLIGMMTRGWDLPAKIENLLEPLKNSLKETWSWYTESMKHINTLPRDELESLIATSLEDDFASSLLSVWGAAQQSQLSPSCLPRAICELANDVPEENNLQMLLTRFGSVAYAGLRANAEDEFMLFIQTARAAVFEGDCQAYFPFKCSTEDRSKGEEADAHHDDDDNDIKNHEEL